MDSFKPMTTGELPDEEYVALVSFMVTITANSWIDVSRKLAEGAITMEELNAPFLDNQALQTTMMNRGKRKM